MCVWERDRERERVKELGLPTLLERGMGNDQIKTFQIINGISNYGRYFFNTSLQTGNLLSRQISKIKSTNQLDILLIESYIFGTNWLIRLKIAIV